MSSTTTTIKPVMPAINIAKWVEKHKHELKPPVSNKYLYDGEDFFVMVIGGPNARCDFHCTASEEYFYQVKGDIYVRIREGGISGPGRIKDYIVREGETFFIPPNVPHAPMRPPGTVGIVVERVRPAGEMEHVIFYCPSCGEIVEDIEFDCKDIVQHFAQAMKDFWADPKRATCKACGHRIEAPGPCQGLPEDGVTSS